VLGISLSVGGIIILRIFRVTKSLSMANNPLEIRHVLRNLAVTKGA
jgi:hypothetical protein